MNKERRKVIYELADKIRELQSEVESVQCEEQEYYDNMPEGIQDGERGVKACEVIDNLQSALDNLDEVIEYLEVAAE